MAAMARRSKWVERLTLIKIKLSRRQSIYRSIITIIFLIIIPIIILILPESYFDNGESVCLSKLLFKQECYACGLTKACQHLLHLNFEKAFEYNMLSYIALPLVSFLWLMWFLQERRKLKSLLKSAEKY